MKKYQRMARIGSEIVKLHRNKLKTPQTMRGLNITGTDEAVLHLTLSELYSSGNLLFFYGVAGYYPLAVFIRGEVICYGKRFGYFGIFAVFFNSLRLFNF